MATTSTTLMILSLIFAIQLASIRTQTTSSTSSTSSEALNSLPATSGILLSIAAASSAGASGIDDRTAEDIRTAFTSPSVSTLLNSSSSSSSAVSQYFFDGNNNDTSADPIKMLQGINSLYVVKVMYDISKKIESTNTLYWFRIRTMWLPTERTLNNFFNQSDFNTSDAAQSETNQSSSDQSLYSGLVIFKFTPLVISALNVTPSFTLDNNPLLSNLTVDGSIPNITQSLFALARLVSIARQLAALVNITTDGTTLNLLNSNLRNFQNVLYSVNQLTDNQLADQITELNFLPVIITAPKVEVTPVNATQTATTSTRKRNNLKRRRSLKTKYI
jgi:hypothetical protein